jgi:molecular chaperone DnaK
MDRQTVDFGIDLGTTNSAIARAMTSGAMIVKIGDTGSDTTPSAVARTSRGQTLVGQEALNKLDLSPARQFKRLMGTDNTEDLADGSRMLPEELSAEVLKELKAAVQLRYDVQPEHAVITVPAMFQQPQCEATRRAAELAGLSVAALLQEPIAAATAFLNENPEEGDYLVYDLGGGTFDVSIVRLRDGEMSVVAHGGDNFLGGADFDREIYEWALCRLERECGSCPELHRSPGKAMLLKSCEEARKRLSTREEAVIDLGDFELPVVQLALDRERLELLIERHVTRTIALARERIDQAGLRPESIRRLLVVGGPTRTPYVRRRLKEELAIPLCLDQDPMTVVTLGAAIHASTLLRPDRATHVSAPGRFAASLELHYDPVSPEIRTTVSGRVMNPASFAGEVRLTRTSGDWETGWIPLRDGAFACEVLLSASAATEFQVSLRDLTGNLWTISPCTITLRCGVAAAKPVAPYNYGVVLENRSLHWLVEHNASLPAAAIWSYRAAKTVPAESNEELVVYFLEGSSSEAADNIKVGELRVRGQDLRRTLQENERIDVRIHMDESRLLKARVSIPLHDLDYDVELHSRIPTLPVEELEQLLEQTQETLREVEPGVAQEDEAAVLQSRRELEQIEAEFERVQRGEPGESERVHNKIAGVKARVRNLQHKYGPRARYHTAIQAIDRAERIARDAEDSLGVATAGDLRREAERCLRLDDQKGLEAVEERARNLFWQHYSQTEECWIGWVGYVRAQRRLATEPVPYDEYVKRAGDCLQRRDFEGVRLNVMQALAYLPDGVEEHESRYRDAGLRA